MSKLDLIRETLESFGKTYYGKAYPKESDDWNYYVFQRENLKKSSNGNNFLRRYNVAIVSENYIPENHEFEVIQAIKNNAKLTLSDTDIRYDYTFKGSTDLVVEVCLITFTENLKGCEI